MSLTTVQLRIDLNNLDNIVHGCTRCFIPKTIDQLLFLFLLNYQSAVNVSQALGWVEAGACRPYSRVRADAAMAALLPDDSPGPSGREGAGTALDAECARCLRLARQFNLSYEPDASAQGLAAAAGLRIAAERLVGIEARLPAAGATLSDNFAFWHAWRRSVRRAESAAEIVPLVLALGQQLRPEILVPGAQGAVMNELHALLDLQPPEPQASSPS